MPVVTMRQLLEAGVHFGHQTRRWNPKMKRYIFTERNGIYILDLQQTMSGIERAYRFTRDLVAGGGTILFVATKRQVQEKVEPESRSVLFAIATAAIFLPRRCATLMIHRLRASVLCRARCTVARAPWINKVRR